MRVPHYLAGALSVSVLLLAAGVASGQEYPNNPIRIVTSEPGGSNDIAARVIASELTASLGQQVIVENWGDSIVIRGMLLVQAPPDGYTLLLYGSTIWLLPFLQDNVPYDPVRDFSPVTLAASAPNIVVVHPSVASNSIKELIALARARPGALNYGSAALGSTSPLAGALFNTLAEVKIVNTPYNGSGPAVLALINGQTQLMFPNAGIETVGRSPDELAAYVMSDMAKMDKGIRDAGIY